MLRLEQLRALKAVSDQGSITSAALALHVTQPTLSHHIAALEAALGGQVLSRSRYGSDLTALGRLALGHAETILDRTAAAERELREAAHRGAITVRVGSFPSAAAALLVPALSSASSAGVRFSLTVDEHPRLLTELRARRLHVAVLAYPPHIAPEPLDGINTAPVLDDPMVLLLPRQHPDGTHAEVPLEHLVNDSWIIADSPGDPAGDELLRTLAARGSELRVAHRVDDYAVTEALVAAGFGVALVPSLATGQLTGQTLVRRLIDTFFVRRLYTAWHARPQSTEIEQLVTAIHRTAARIQASYQST